MYNDKFSSFNIHDIETSQKGVILSILIEFVSVRKVGYRIFELNNISGVTRLIESYVDVSEEKEKELFVCAKDAFSMHGTQLSIC